MKRRIAIKVFKNVNKTWQYKKFKYSHGIVDHAYKRFKVSPSVMVMRYPSYINGGYAMSTWGKVYNSAKDIFVKIGTDYDGDAVDVYGKDICNDNKWLRLSAPLMNKYKCKAPHHTVMWCF